MVTAVVLLNAYGVLMIRSAITNTPAFVGYEQRQIIFAILGLVVMIIVAAIDYRIFTSAHWFIYAGIVLVLIFTAFFTEPQNGVAGWINLGPVNIQPAEFGRILLPITLGQFLANRQQNLHRFKTTLLSIAYMGVPILFILIQPDLGMSILFIVIWFGIVMIAGLPLRHFFILAVTGIIAGAALYPVMPEYQQARLQVFLEPEANPDEFFNIQNALISVGSGGWWGKGYFNGTQSQLGFLRVQHTDFIFSMLTEEMGFFFGSLVVVGLIGFILLRILRVASITTDPAGRYICVGIGIALFFQTVVSVGMNVNVMPVTGLTFPWVSYGGSSLLTLYIGIGFVQSVLMRHRKQAFG